MNKQVRACSTCGQPIFWARGVFTMCSACTERHCLTRVFKRLRQTIDDPWRTYMTLSASTCRCCRKLPGLARLTGLCQDCYKMMYIDQKLLARNELLKHLAQVDTDIAKAQAVLAGPNAQDVARGVKHFCTCGKPYTSYLELSHHIAELDSPDHRYREELAVKTSHYRPASAGGRKREPLDLDTFDLSKLG